MTTNASPRRPYGAEAMREAAAKVARSTHIEEVRDPGIYGHADQYYSVRVPNFPTDGEQIAALIEALPLPAGDTLSPGGWNSDMELDEPRLKRAAEALIAEAGAIRSGLGMGPISTSVGGISAGNYRLLRAAIRAALPEIFAPEPPPGE